MNFTPDQPLAEATAPSPGTYTPGYAKQKVLVIVIGLLVAALGFAQLWGPLRLLLFGRQAMAEAVRIVKIAPGQADVVLTTDAEVQAEVNRQHRAAVFWNEYRFLTAEGRTVNVRASVGSQGRPLAPLVGSDGLPTVLRVCYDPARPERVAFLALMSTWLAPGMIVFCGLLAVLIGSVLLYWAGKPIELPHIPPTAQ